MLGDVADRTLPREQLAEMLRFVRPDWRLRDATLTDSGWTTVYHLDVDTDDGQRTCVLKASPDDDRSAGIDTEARIQTVVDEHTAIPVPSVVGAVDDHGTLRTPYFLMETLSGQPLSRAEGSSLPDAQLRQIARQTGRYLGQLHDLDVGLEAYGDGVDHERSRTLRGERPPADPSRLVVADGYARWTAQLRDWFEEDLQTLADSRFGDLAPRLRAEQARRLEALPETFSPVLEHGDPNWDNLLVDRDAGRLEGVLDWGEAHAVPRGFSLAFVEYALAGRWGIALPDVPHRRPLVRDALLSGYREVTTVPPTLVAQRRCYQLNLLVVDMGCLEERASSSAPIPAERIEEAVAGYRAAAEAELERDSP